MHVGTLPPDGNWMGNSELPGISFEQLPKPVQEKGWNVDSMTTPADIDIKMEVTDSIAFAL